MFKCISILIITLSTTLISCTNHSLPSIPLSIIVSERPYITVINNVPLGITISEDHKDIIAVILIDFLATKEEIKWSSEDNRFINPINGSAFSLDGLYLLGPSSHNLSRVRGYVEGNNIFIDTSIIYTDQQHN